MYKAFFAFVILWTWCTSAFAQEVNFSEHIAPIVFEHCTPCHQKGKIAPMPLTNYQEVSSYAAMIGYVTKVKYMPPWKAVNDNHQYVGAKPLSPLEIQQIQNWIEQGTPEGDPEKLPKHSISTGENQMKNPDAVLSMSEAFEQYGVYYDQFRVFVLSTDFGEDKEIVGIEFVPGAESIVRSCFISLDTSNKVIALDNWDPQYGYFSFGELGFVPMQSRWYTWHPQKNYAPLSRGKAKLLPKNAKLLLHIHYGPTGVRLKDSSYVRLKFAKKKATKLVQHVPLIHPYLLTNPPFEIAANEKKRFHAKFRIPFDLELSAIIPHSHLLGKKWEIFAVDTLSKAVQTLLKITDWDFKWKQQFEFTSPVFLKKGTLVHALAEYDNTLENLSNPSEPPRKMTLGKRMFEEMFLVYFEFTPMNSNSKDLQLLPIQSLFSTPQFSFDFITTKEESLSCQIFNFEGELVLNVFQQEVFEKGRHTIPIDFEAKPKGNYYIQLSNNQTKKQAAQQVFVFCESKFFD